MVMPKCPSGPGNDESNPTPLSRSLQLEELLVAPNVIQKSDACACFSAFNKPSPAIW